MLPELKEHIILNELDRSLLPSALTIAGFN